MPLGSHKPPYTELAVEDGFPSALDFFDKYVAGSKPVLLRGAAKELKAYKLWTDEYMSKNYGHELVEVEEGKKEDRDLSMWTETYGDFLRKYQGKDRKDRFKGNFYSVSAMVQGMRKEYTLPRSVDCAAFYKNSRGGMRQINHWFSSGGTSSVLHKDGFENLNCLMDGTKDLVFIPSNYSERQLYWDYRDNHGHSQIDCDSVDMKRYPGFQHMQWFPAHMERGDCLFIPYGWYHHVKSHAGPNQRNMAINLWWEMDKSAAGRRLVEKCTEPKTPTTAAQLRFSREQLPEASMGGPPGGDDQDDDDDL